MDPEKENDDQGTSSAAIAEGGLQGACDDGCSICLEEFSQSDPSTVTDCKHRFHLHCILEWFHRSANCPMCWQPIKLNDATSQNLMEAIEHERSLKANRLRNPTRYYHPTLANIDLHLPTDASEIDLEEHIFQHLAAAATMRSRHHVFQREGQRLGMSSQGQRLFFIFSAAASPHDASVSSSINPVEGGSQSNAMALETASIISSSTRNAQVSVSLSPSQMNKFSFRRVGSNATSAYRPRFVSEARFASQSSRGSHNTANLQSSESLRSRLNAWSMRYKKSIARSTRVWKERLFARSTTMAGRSSEVQREVNSGMCGFSRLMERPDSRVSNGSGLASGASHAGRSTRSGYLDE